MGNRLIQQRRGKGLPTYKSPKHRFIGAIHFPDFQNKIIRGEVMDLINCRGHSSPLAYAEFEDGQICLYPAVEGLCVGDVIETGTTETANIGSIVMLKNITSGTSINCIELTPGSGPSLVRASGSAARVVEQGEKIVVIQLPSRRKLRLNSKCRATIGKIAGGGRVEKPFVKAGKKMLAMRAKNKLYPRTSGVAMNANDHPFGGTHRRTKGQSKSVSRDAPPGRKVGAIASKRTGRKKR